LIGVLLKDSVTNLGGVDGSNNFLDNNIESPDIMNSRFTAPTGAITDAINAESGRYNIFGSSCATYTSIAEWNSGVFTFGLLPSVSGALFTLKDYYYLPSCIIH